MKNFSNHFSTVNVTQPIVESLVTHLIDVRFHHLKSEIKITEVIKTVLQHPSVPLLNANSFKEINQQKIRFHQEFEFQVRRVIIDTLHQIAKKVEHRVSNSIVVIDSKRRRETLAKKSPFRAKFRVTNSRVISRTSSS